MGASRGHIVTAITLSGCSLLLLSLLRQKLTVIGNKWNRIARSLLDSGTTNQDDERNNKTTKIAYSSGGVRKKKVRFSDGVEEPSINNKEYTRRRSRVSSLRGQQHDNGTKTMRYEPRNKGVCLPRNRSALYNGICRYRSQRAILTIYA